MSAVKLNASFINKLAARSKEYAVYDAEVRGLLLKVTPTGRKAYFLWYRTREGRARKLKLGDHGILTPHQARERARKLLFAISAGEDPAMELSIVRSAPTMKELAERFLSHVNAYNKPRTAEEYARLLKNKVVRHLGHLKVYSVTKTDVESMHQRLSDTPYEANRALALLSVMFNKAEEWGWRDENTNFCRKIRRYPEQRRGLVLQAEELRKIGMALKAALAGDLAARQQALALLLLMFTGCRKTEIRTLRWEYIDFDNGIISFPDSKVGARVHVLGSAAIRLLQAIPSGSSLFVFPRIDALDEPMSDSTLAKAWVRIRRDAELDHVRVHDLRHNRGSWGAKSNYGSFILKEMLGHKDISTSQRYIHFDNQTLRRANDGLDQQLVAAMGAAAQEDLSKVLCVEPTKTDPDLGTSEK